MDPVARFLRGKTVRRGIALAAFVGLLIAFRHLIPLLVFFLLFSRTLGPAAGSIAARTRLGRKASLLALVGIFLAVVGMLIWIGIGRGIRVVVTLRETLPERIAQIRETPLYQTLHEHFKESDTYLDGAKHYATTAAHYLTEFGHMIVFATIGLILAVIFLFEEEELWRWARAIDPHSLIGTLVRWFAHVADAVLITIQLQLVVAGCNAVLTFPVLIALGLPHPGALALMIFATSLVPVVGNLISGVILSLLAYHVHGWVGVGVFVVLTAVLHKIESYYLNPRLTARHVRLPGFVLILSLIAWEHLLGIAGLFVSFPFLFVAMRIRREIADEDTPPVAALPPPASTGAIAS